MGASKRWNLGLMRWRSSLANSASAWRISKDCWKDCARPSPDGSRLAKGACPDLENKVEYRIKGLTMGRRSGAQNTKSQEPRAKSQEPRAKSQEPSYTSDLSRPARASAPSASAAGLSCGRTLLVLLAVLSAVLRSIFAVSRNPRLPHHGRKRAVFVFAALLLLSIGNVRAQVPVVVEVTLVSNTGEQTNAHLTVGRHTHNHWVHAQRFTTGNNETGYTLTSVSIVIADTTNAPLTEDADPQVSIYTATATGPGNSLIVTTAPSSLSVGVNTFTASGNTQLAASTNYFLVIESASGEESRRFAITGTSAGGEEGQDGWSIRNSRLQKQTVSYTTVESSSVKVAITGVVNPRLAFIEGETATRRVDANAAIGTLVGEPVTATHEDEGYMLTYALSGRDASAFTINPSTAQLRTAADLTLFSYLVTVTVDDDESGSDSIVVIITTYPARENSCEYTGQLHEGDWTFYTTSAPQAGSVSLTLTEDDLPTQVCGHNGDHYTTTSNVQLYCSVQVDPALYEWVEIRSCDFISTPTPPTTTPGDGDGDGGDGGDTDDGGDGGGGGTTTSAPGVPRNLDAVAGNGEVVLSWDAPESDGGEAITDYEYRINGQNPWISTGSTETTHTVTGLDNGAEYTFEVRAVNRVGKSFAPSQVEATPEAPEVFTLDFAHFANGDGTTSELVFVNVGSVPVRPALYFYDTGGKPIDPGSVVDVTGDLEVTEDGGLSIPAMEPLGELTISTHGQGELVSGSVKVVSYGPIGGVLRFDLPGIGVAGVGASPPVRDAVFPVRRQEAGINTGVALHNLESSPELVRCELMREGVLHDAVSIPLAANGQSSWFIDAAFPAADTSDFAGSVHCDAEGPGMFTAVALELDAASRIFTTLPVLSTRRAGGRAAELNFAHFANGAGLTSELVFVNLSTERSRPAPTPFHTDILPVRPAIYFYDTEGALVSAESVVDITGDLEVTEDGGVTVQTEMEPLGVLTISTHGRGELVSGSVRVAADEPIGGALRFDLPGIGVAGVGASPPVSDALFPVRRQEAGINTGVAVHNLGEEAMEVTCELMQGGTVLDDVSIPLAANGQSSWFINEVFTGADTSDFTGSVRCTAPGEGMFTGVAVELDAANRIFTTLPVVPVPERMSQE